ncbi:MAG: hypothetical protein LBQ70_05915 [Prevotellaceae bacterium]|jgi:tetratricopeptide (TPR) repeat protein|nr:hypothetical protein [Prevotellaceae bacterium]
MNFKLLDKYINLDIPVGTGEINDLEALVSENPWFALGRVLLLKGYSNENRPEYGEACRLTAFYTPARKRLYRFLAKKNVEDAQTHTNTGGEAKSVPENRDLSFFSREYFAPDDFSAVFSNNNGSEKDDLIANFIKESPKIIPAADIVPQDLNFEKTVDDNDIASETLAEIYLSQGLYDRAIECYGKLILQDSKKSIYFAAKIDEIRNLKK